jgi:HECT-domain (ubiquitin-transferase)
MISKENRIKEGIKKAHAQMSQGCCNKSCLNTYCRVSNKTSNELALECIELAKKSPDHDLEMSPDFIFCEKPAYIYTAADLLSLDESGIINAFSDVLVLGNSIASGPITREHPSIDWKGLEDFYQHSKKLCDSGLLNPRWLESCVQSFNLSPYKSLYLARASLIILSYPLLSELEYSNILILISSQLSSFPSQSELLSTWLNEFSSEQIHYLNWILQQVISVKILQNLEDDNLEVIRYVLKLIDCIYRSNERVVRINYKEFYNDAVNQEINLKTDFKNWFLHKQKKKSQVFAFAFFPWILDSNSKSEFLILENTEIMRQEIHNSVFYEHNTEFYVHLEVERGRLIEDTLSQLLSGELNIKKPLKVHFIGEEGVDEGGVKKEFFQLIVKELFDPEFSMFNYYEGQRLFWFNPDTIESNVNFELIGIILGMAIYNAIILDVHLPMATYKKILGLPTDIEDLSEFNPELVKGLKVLLNFEGDVQEVFCKSFCIETEVFGQIKRHQLKENGENIPVTNENRVEYVRLYVDWWLNKGIEKIFEEFKGGFLKVCGGEVLNMFKPQELELLICGNPILDFKALESVAKYEGFTKASLTVKFT